MICLQLYVLRHGEPDLKDGFYGHEDVMLSELGRGHAAAQARALAGKRLAAIYCSDLRRASDGAALLAAASGRPAPVALPALREMHLGVLERVTFVDAQARHPELVTRGYQSMLSFRMPGGGESVQDVADRALPCVQALIARHLAGPGEPAPAVAIVAHNTVNRVLLACAAGLGPAAFIRFEQALGAISRIDFFAPCDPADPWAAARLGLCNYVPGAEP